MSPLHYLLFISLAISSSFPSISAQACNKADMHALLRIKKSLGNPAELSSWDPARAADCCSSWKGVGCGHGGRITSIGIFYSNVSGSLPTFIGDLPALTTINLYNLPNLAGPIPPSIAKLKSLRQLTVSHTALSGPIPAFLCTMSLAHLDLSGNRLAGTIPSCLMSGLVEAPPTLILSGNQLTGRIPKSFNDMAFVKVDLSRNQLTGDAAFMFDGNKFSLDSINLSWNRFEFDLSPATFPLGLGELDLSHNVIRGRIPEQITSVQKMRALDLSYNRLCGPIPPLPKPFSELAILFEHNKCLCGAPLSPCKKRSSVLES